MQKDLVDLSEQELFVSIPIDERLLTQGTKKTEQLLLKQRSVIKEKVLHDEEPADTRLKINSASQVDIYFTQKVQLTKSQKVQFIEQVNSTDKRDLFAGGKRGRKRI